MTTEGAGPGEASDRLIIQRYLLPPHISRLLREAGHVRSDRSRSGRYGRGSIAYTQGYRVKGNLDDDGARYRDVRVWYKAALHDADAAAKLAEYADVIRGDGWHVREEAGDGPLHLVVTAPAAEADHLPEGPPQEPQAAWHCEDCGWLWPLAGEPPEGSECDSCGGEMVRQ